MSYDNDISDHDLAIMLHNEIVKIANIFIRCENVEIEHLKGLNPSLGSVAKLAKSISLKISKLINDEVWEGQRILINAQQAVCLMEEAALGVLNNSKSAVIDAINRLKSIKEE
ncbi:MAG: hypothetical protein J6577_01380 [Gilliamella sp.]|nr:hypothetical protein [Gilliamella sp.]